MPAERIASYLASRDPVADHRPWPRYEVEAETWTAIGEALAAGGGDLLALWADRAQVHLALRAEGLASPVVLSVGVKHGAFPAIGQHHAPAIRLERAIRDLYGHVPIGCAAPSGARTPLARSWRLGRACPAGSRAAD